jgi:DNA-binding LacI/PurR family transcriptional regulator
MQPTLRDIATLAGVSIQTASVVMAGRERENRISDERAAMVREIAQRVGYRPHAAARAMRLKRSDMIGVLVQRAPGHHATHNDAMNLVMGINAGLEDAEKVMCLVRLTDVIADGELHAKVFRERLLDGIIVVNAVPDLLHDRLLELVPRCVWVDHNRYDAHACIRRDERQAGRVVVEQLWARGYRRFVYVKYPVERKSAHYSEIERWAGVCEAAAERGVQVEQQSVPLLAPAPQPLAWLGALTPNTAIIAYDAPAARSTLGCVATTGFAIGRDFGLACCDDAFDLANVARVQFDRGRLGKQAAEMMVKMLGAGKRQPKSELLQGQWIEGVTAPPCGG